MTRVESSANHEERDTNGKDNQIRLPQCVALHAFTVGGLAYHVPSMLQIRCFVRTDLTKLDQSKVERFKCGWGKR